MLQNSHREGTYLCRIHFICAFFTSHTSWENVSNQITSHKFIFIYFTYYLLFHFIYFNYTSSGLYPKYKLCKGKAFLHVWGKSMISTLFLGIPQPALQAAPEKMQKPEAENVCSVSRAPHSKLDPTQYVIDIILLMVPLFHFCRIPL